MRTCTRTGLERARPLLETGKFGSDLVLQPLRITLLPELRFEVLPIVCRRHFLSHRRQGRLCPAPPGGIVRIERKRFGKGIDGILGITSGQILRTVLEAANARLEDVVDVTVFLVDMQRDFPTFNKVYGEYFASIGPTRTTVEVRALPTPIAVELKVIAYPSGPSTLSNEGAA